MTNPDANEDGRAVREIAKNRALLAEAEALLPVLEQALQPADEGQRMAVLIDESVCYDLDAKDHHDAGWAAFWAPYHRALDGFSVTALREAFVMWNRNHIKPEGEAVRFYPRPAQLFDLATEARNRLGMMRYRARAALEYLPPAERKPIRPEDRLTREEAMAMIRGVGAKTIPTPPRMRIIPDPPPQNTYQAPTTSGPILDDEEAV